ncbi:amidase family protein, partial [Streptobacillus moniliformis]|uniref:amidase family protein n=1 Tax=Streptobacillus moniliformis TaxID=34105 RepID=UPI000A9EB67A
YEDVANTLEILAGEDIYDPTTSDVEVPKYSEYLDQDIYGLTIGIDKQFFEGLSNEIKESIETALDTLVQMGAVIVDLRLDYAKYSIPPYYIITSAEASS